MTPELRKIKVQDVIDAIAANGFRWLREQWVQVDDSGKPIAGCVLGQAAINLDVVPEPYFVPDDAEAPETYTPRHTLLEQLNKFMTDNLVQSVYFNGRKNTGAAGAGTAIYGWNDAPAVRVTIDAETVLFPSMDSYADYLLSVHKAPETDEDWKKLYDNHEEIWVLETYQEMVEKAKEILAPFANEEIEVLTNVFGWDG